VPTITNEVQSYRQPERTPLGDLPAWAGFHFDGGTMRITFEKVSDQLYIRNELYQSLVRSVFALHPGDLSVQLDDRDRSRSVWPVMGSLRSGRRS